jgi:hypothetical protein
MGTWRGVAREWLETERQAETDVITTWVGPGSGRLCSGCSRVIEFGEVECELELPGNFGIKPLRFHCDCYRIWSGEQPAEPVSRNAR